ncbi:MarR family protein [Ilumatobacter fluminis]|uniref:MarR family protein n=2 Tax=Ilumatobacter fluminis TaxID=467091 RepID=A0A4V6Q1X4_9ACTN|nr:MarR family protein [Ilumatobacter fluminis]
MNDTKRRRSDRYDRSTMSSATETDTDTDAGDGRPSWTFLTNHAHVLVAIGQDPEMRQRDIADAVGITPGAVTRILAELEASGCVTHERVGRRNRYHINPEVHFRHPLESEVTIGQLIELTDGIID